MNITQAQISEVLKVMQDVYKVDAGSLDNVSGLELSVKDVLVKLDWNISEKHRANVRYTKTEQSDLLQAMYGRNGDCPLAVIAACTSACESARS